MKLRKKMAFITAMALFAGTQAAFVSAAEEEVTENVVSEESTETADTSDTADTGYERSDNPEDWRTPAGEIDEENGTINGCPILGQVENEGRVYDYVWQNGDSYTCFARDELANINVSDSVTKPGSITYLDIRFEGSVQLSYFINMLKYDKDALTLVSASLDESIPVMIEPGGENWPDFTFNSKGILFYSRPDLKNIDLSGEHTVRLAFQVNETAAEGRYEIGLTNIDSGGLTGLLRIEESSDKFFMVYVPVKYNSGSITVSETETPKTNLKQKPLARTYAMIENENSLVTGDANEDGTINVMDVLKMKGYLLGTDQTVRNADANEDGVQNIADMIVLRDYILNK